MKTRRLTILSCGAATLVAALIALWLLSGDRPHPAPVVVVPPSLAPAAAQPSEAVPEIPEPVVPAPAAPVLSPVVAVPAPVVSVTQTPAPVAAPVVPTQTPRPAAGPVDEVAASERMYLAHAPLREPEVADPDSEANRRILQTMVTKALAAQAAATPVTH